jgi:3-hydroxyisobutyrate dehydrogenase
MDMNTTYEAIRISSGNSFVHETESQVILIGSRDINFTMDLVVKDIGLFDKLANANNVPLEISPLVLNISKDGQLFAVVPSSVSSSPSSSSPVPITVPFSIPI